MNFYRGSVTDFAEGYQQQGVFSRDKLPGTLTNVLYIEAITNGYASIDIYKLLVRIRYGWKDENVVFVTDKRRCGVETVKMFLL